MILQLFFLKKASPSPGGSGSVAAANWQENFGGAATKTERFIIFENGNNGLLKECKPFALRAQGLLCLGWKQRTTQTHKPCGFLATRLSAGRRTAARCTDPFASPLFIPMDLLPEGHRFYFQK